jgi:glucose-6-phosphate 1-epimerase
MGHSAAVWDFRAATEITKDQNGIGQVVLRTPQGASARVRRTCRLIYSHCF